MITAGRDLWKPKPLILKGGTLKLRKTRTAHWAHTVTCLPTASVVPHGHSFLPLFPALWMLCATPASRGRRSSTDAGSASLPTTVTAPARRMLGWTTRTNVQPSRDMARCPTRTSGQSWALGWGFGFPDVRWGVGWQWGHHTSVQASLVKSKSGESPKEAMIASSVPSVGLGCA